MRREIDILVEAARKQCAVVEKTSNLLWTHAELAEARAAGLYQGESSLRSPDGRMAVSGPFPGCCQQAAAPPLTSGYRAVGQPEHFVIFVAPDAGNAPAPGGS